MSEFRKYVAVIEQNSRGRFFAHIPDLPGVTASGSTVDEALTFLSDFADEYVRDMAADGQKVPVATTVDELPHDPEVKEFMRAIMPVRLPLEVSRTLKISLSIDERMLERIDLAAKRVGESRSGFFASAAGVRADGILRPPSITTEDMAHAIEKAGGLAAVLEDVARRRRA